MKETALTPTSFIVLGLLERLGEATPYELKQTATRTLGNFWSVPHSQVYAEPERLERGGYAQSTQEDSGRRRRRYRLTAAGRDALERWRRDPGDEDQVELRDPSLLKLALGADPGDLAAAQLEVHERRLAAYEQRRAEDPGTGPRGPWLTLEAGIGHEREWVRFWAALAGEDGAFPSS